MTRCPSQANNRAARHQRMTLHRAVRGETRQIPGQDSSGLSGHEIDFQGVDGRVDEAGTRSLHSRCDHVG